MIPTTVDALRAVIEHIGQPVFVKDRSYRFVLVNPPFSALVSRPPAAVVGRTDFDFFPLEQAEYFRSVDSDVFERGEAVVVEEEALTDLDGMLHLLRTTKAPMRDASGAVTHLVGVITDVTTTKHAERSLRDANEELEHRVRERTAALESAQAELLRKERLSVLGHLTAGLAHQIRNPLAAIATASAILRRKLASSGDPDVAHALAAILEEVWGANRIITDLVEYARVKAPMLAPVSVEELLEQALGSTTPPASIQIEQEIEPDLVVEVDLAQARDAIASVIRNGYEAMPQGGRVLVVACRDGDEVLVAVEDSGPGLTRESIKDLFEPLVTSKPLGLGLGLATARLLLENQKGSIRAATQRGGGARFEIRLPLAR